MTDAHKSSVVLLRDKSDQFLPNFPLGIVPVGLKVHLGQYEQKTLIDRKCPFCKNAVAYEIRFPIIVRYIMRSCVPWNWENFGKVKKKHSGKTFCTFSENILKMYRIVTDVKRN